MNTVDETGTQPAENKKIIGQPLDVKVIYDAMLERSGEHNFLLQILGTISELNQALERKLDIDGILPSDVIAALLSDMTIVLSQLNHIFMKDKGVVTRLTMEKLYKLEKEFIQEDER